MCVPVLTALFHCLVGRGERPPVARFPQWVKVPSRNPLVSRFLLLPSSSGSTDLADSVPVLRYHRDVVEAECVWL